MWKTEMKKRIVVGVMLVLLWAVCMWLMGCGELLKSGGHLAKGIGDASTALGDHMIETVVEGD